MQAFNIDISRKNGPLVLYAKQSDSLSRFFKIVFLQDGAPWKPPAGALFSVRFGAPGMPDGWYDTIKEPDGSTHSAFSLKDNTLTVELAYEAVSKAGTNTLAVLVLDSGGYQLGMWNLSLQVEITPGENSPEADVYYSLLSEQVAQVLQAKDDAQASAILSQSWAVGGTGSRAGEDTNNSKYWAGQAQQSAQESLGFRTFFGAVRPDLNGDLDPSSPMFAGTGTSITVRSAANRIENVTSHGFTEQAGTGDASPANQRPITVGGKLWLEHAFTGEEVWKIASSNMIYNAPVTMVEATRTNGQCSDIKWIARTDLKVDGTPGIATCSAFNIIVNHPDYFTNVEAWKAYLKKRYTEGNPFKVWVTPSDSSKATGLYTPQISEGESYHCNCIKLQQHLCEGDTLDSNVPSGCDKHVVFDGSSDEMWRVAGSGANIFFVLDGGIPGNKGTPVNSIFSSRYAYQLISSQNTMDGIRGYDEAVYIRDSRFSDAESWKKNLQKNPLPVFYRSTEYTTKNDEKVCMERHVRFKHTLTSADDWKSGGGSGTDQYYCALPFPAQTGDEICTQYKRSTSASTVNSFQCTGASVYIRTEAGAFASLEDWKAHLDSEKAAGRPVDVEYQLSTPLIYTSDPVDLPAYPITTAAQATLEEPTTDTPMLLAQQGETGTYTVSGEKTISLYIKALIKDGDAATLGGKPPEYFLPADQPAVGAAKSSKPTFAVNYGRIVSPDNSGLYLRNADRDGAGIFVGVREDFQSLTPDHNTSGGSSNLGAPSYRWRIGYFVNQPDVSSDQNMKEQIEPLSEKQMLFFDALKPVQYKLKGGSHDRLHYGFIAQEVEQAMAAAGISDMEFGGFCKDRKIKVVRQYSEEGELIGEAEEELEGYEYSLRYGEFIALNTAAIQAMKKEISDLKAEINKLKGV